MDTYSQAIVSPAGEILCTVPANRSMIDGKLCKADGTPAPMEGYWSQGCTLRPLDEAQHRAYHDAQRPYQDACEAINRAFGAKLQQHVMVHGEPPTDAEVAALAATLPPEPAKPVRYLDRDGRVTDKAVALVEPVDVDRGGRECWCDSVPAETTKAEWIAEAAAHGLDTTGLAVMLKSAMIAEIRKRAGC